MCHWQRCEVVANIMTWRTLACSMRSHNIWAIVFLVSSLYSMFPLLHIASGRTGMEKTPDRCSAIRCLSLHGTQVPLNKCEQERSGFLSHLGSENEIWELRKECLQILRDLCYSIPSLAEQLSSDRTFLIFLFSVSRNVSNICPRHKTDCCPAVSFAHACFPYLAHLTQFRHDCSS